MSKNGFLARQKAEREKDHQEFIPFEGRYLDVKRIKYEKRRW